MTKPLSASTPVKRLHCWIILNTAVINSPVSEKLITKKQNCVDLAIVTLLLGTGIRVSECVGLDVEDIDFRNNGIRLIRKGGSEMVVYFGPEVEKALKDYLEARKAISPLEGHEHALFYSTSENVSAFRRWKIWSKSMPVPSQLQKNHTTQTEKYLWYHFISGNR